MNVPWKSFGWLCPAVILTYMAVMVVGFFMPLQSDEMAWLLLNDRAWADHKEIIGLYPQCGKEAFAHPLPLIWYIPAYVNYLTYGNIASPLGIRIGGMVQFFLWFGVWLLIAAKLFPAAFEKKWIGVGVLLAFLGLDALPLAFVVNRPEQILLVGISAYITIALYADELSRSITRKCLGTLLLFFIAMVVHSSHPKSLALLPLELFMGGIFLARAWRMRAVTTAGLLALAFIAAQSYETAYERLQCPGSADARAYLEQQYLSLKILREAPLTFIAKAAHNVGLSLITDLNLHADMQIEPVWIPLSLHPLAAPVNLLVSLMDNYAWIIYLLSLGVAVWIFARHALVRPASAEQALTLRLALAGLLVFIAALLALLQEAIFYIAALGVPLVLLALMLALGLQYRVSPWKTALPARCAVIVLGLALLNLGLLICRYGEFVGSEQAYEALPFDHRAFTSTQDYAQKENTLRDLAEQCHIGTGPEARHVVLDEVAYPVFRKTFEPLFFTYSTWLCCHPKKREDISRNDTALWFKTAPYFQLLRDYGSDGIIGKCSLFPDPLLPFARQQGGLCCIPKTAFTSDSR